MCEEKCWGRVRHDFYGPDVGLSRLELDPGFRCSRHYHEQRVNHFVVIEGSVCIERWPGGPGRPKTMTVLSAGDSLSVPAGEWHRFRTMAGGTVIEVYWPDPKREPAEVRFDDIVRADEGGEDDLDGLERELNEAGL